VVAALITRGLAAQSWNYLTLFLARSLEHAFSSVSVLGFSTGPLRHFWFFGQTNSRRCDLRIVQRA
jgi:hypothetical protein